MPKEQIKINNLRKYLNTQLIISGFSGMKGSYSNLKRIIKAFGFVNDKIKEIVDIPIVQRDMNYYLTSRGNLSGMIDIIQNIVKHFKWEKEYFDCDDRAKLVSALFSLFFGINVCGEVYCQVTSLKTGNKYNHWTNVIITSEGDFCLYDVDNQGQSTILTKGQPFTMGKYSYKFISARF